MGYEETRYDEEFKKQAYERLAEVEGEMKDWARKTALKAFLSQQIQDCMIQALRDGSELTTGGGQDRDEVMERFEGVGLGYSVLDCMGLAPSRRHSAWEPQIPTLGPQPGDRIMRLPPKGASCLDGIFTDEPFEPSEDDHKIALAQNTAGLFPVLKGIFNF